MYTLYMARYKWCHDTELKKKHKPIPKLKSIFNITNEQTRNGENKA